VIVIKLADRLHNMRTLGALREDRRIFKARETLEIYAPIAHRLGINNIKWELEDLSFYYLEPNKFKQISRMVTESRSEREGYLDQIISILHDEMEKVNIQAQIMGRPKHLYSIYQKMTKKGKGFSEIYDLIAVRVIVKSVKDCYSALGAVHTLWHPMPGRFKDYIAMPKFNMYQSLHTTVIGPAGRPLEVQIRTEDMHRQSEYGVAAHWRYKEKGGKSGDALDQQLAWLRQMVDWQDESQDSREFLKDLKVDLAPTEVFVFTPKGEVMSLRAGSTPVDFAYAIHTEVGNHCVGAKVNGAIVPLTYELQLGDRVD
ncbi:bifunctional (p)ppGpp synthetase/guanosine-3',5'-bis(diphosphate) 3'-pyrophosphohydrolase, partial [Clostridioides difficile]|nr:bifunctional (p)ppGpp synthetase/guanosine-3',5'-bis(diphosphate) 3'-pyrophosphohydrolase [Clostridioides difficile]